MTGPRQSVVGVIAHKGEVLMLLRPPDDRSFPGLWCFPGGKVDEGEDPLTALRREVREETGLRPRLVLWDPLLYDLVAGGGSHVIDASLLHWGTARPPIHLSSEHVDFTWVSPATALQDLPMGPATRTILEEAQRVLALAPEGE